MAWRMRAVRWAAGTAALVLVAYACLVEPNRPVLRRVSVPCPGLRAPVSLLVVSDVDYPRAAAGRALVRRVAESDRPDAILIPGDFLDRASALRDPATVAAARVEIASWPAASGRFLALGEEESGFLRVLRAAWAGGDVIVGSNEARTVETPGGPIDLFIADRRTDPAPWGTSIAQARPVLRSGSRNVTSEIRYDGPGGSSWGDVEITFAFRLDDADAFLDIRFGWQPAPVPDAGTGWRLIRHAYSPEFRLLPRFRGDHTVAGRTASGYVPEPGIWHRARVVLRDDGTCVRVRARFWPERGVEPPVWLVDVVDRGPDRRRQGTLGFAGRFGEREIADLKVASPDGGVLLEERFDAHARFVATWSGTSRLAAWSRRVGGPPKVVLSHHPDVVLDLDAIEAPPPALVVAGHTHGGQIAVPGFGPLVTSSRLPRRFARGYGLWHGIPLLTTVGIGTSLVPARFLVPPEVVLVTLEPAGGSPSGAGTMAPPGDPR